MGLAYATVQLTHAAAILTLFVTTGTSFAAADVIGGGFGMLCVVAMAASSNDAAVRRLGGRRWRALHRFGVHYLWIVYLATYVGRVVERDLGYAPLLALTLSLPGVRFAAWIRTRNQ